MNKKYLLFLLLTVVIVSATANFAYAVETKYPEIMGMTITNESSFADYFKYLFNIGITIAGSLALIALAFGGTYYLIAFSRGKYTNEGKDWIKAGIKGFLLVLCAYLIVFTINPDLVVFKIGDFKKVSLGQMFSLNPKEGPPAEVYKEIPLGVLTENLLTRTAYCYDFDAEGNPMPLLLNTDDSGKILGPTYKNHDRVDCLIKLMDAAQKKAKIASDLAAQLKKLMQTCSCEGKCEDPCNKNGKGCQLAGGAKCAGACTGENNEGAACAQPANSESCCEPEVKNRIEHGPVQVGCGAQNVFDNSQNNIFASSGTASPDTNDLNIVDKILAGLFNNTFLAQFLPEGLCQCGGGLPPAKECCPGAGGVNAGQNNPAGNNNAGVNNPGAGGAGGAGCNDKCDNPLRNFRGLDEFRTTLTNISGLIEQNVKIEKQDVAVINVNGGQGIQTIKKWSDLKLVEQLMYFKEKIAEMQSEIREDLNQLGTASSSLNQCYFAKSYIDFLKISEQTNNKDKLILINKTFNDSATRQKVDISKYCKGFNYSNSVCYNKCQSFCPDSSEQAIKCYGSCGECKPDDKNCLKQQKTCIGNCFSQKPCTLNESYKNFDNCISSCHTECLDLCSKTYLKCSGDYDVCQQQCNDNSKCVLENKGECLLNSQSTQSCAAKSNNSANVKDCLDKSYLCKYGSNENAGYADCLKKPYSLGNDFSSPFIFEHQNYQKCQEPYKLYNPNTGRQTCQDIYPETAKCLSASYCPTCPCGQVDLKYSFKIDIPGDNGIFGQPGPKLIIQPDVYEPGGGGGGNIPGGGGGGGSSITISGKVSAYELVTGECNEFAYNDDPLTFYCKEPQLLDDEAKTQSKKENPIGIKRVCSLENEIPAGQAVDDAMSWASKLLQTADYYADSIKDMMNTIKKISDKKPPEYCRCDSKFDTKKPICTSNCQYVPPQKIGENDNGVPIFSQPSCALIACKGNSCQQMIDYMSKISEDYANMRKSYINLFIDSLKDGRTDPLKELTYSRQKTSSCSLNQNIYGTKTEMLSCERVFDELIPRISESKIIVDKKELKSYCYGAPLKKALEKSATNNWFCCEEYDTGVDAGEKPQ